MPGFELIGREERDALDHLLQQSGILSAHGFDNRRNGIFEVRTFEKEFASHLGSRHGVAVSSGTAAVKVALKALGIQPGDEVITQAFNFIAVVEAILDCGATPKITNVDGSLNMDPIELRKKITHKTKAIIVVHMMGASANMEELLRIAEENHIPVIEDNCEAPGATWNGQYLGTLGDIGVFSFDMGKLMTAGEGGMIVTNDDTLAKFCREYPDHGHENNPSLPRGRDSRTIFGFNYRMTEMQAAVGRVQLKRLPFMLEENRQRYAALQNKLSERTRKIFSASVSNDEIFILHESDPEKRARVLSLLKETGIGTKNLPDAIEWHCTAFWDHALEDHEWRSSLPTRELLERSIAIPIWLKRSVSDYETLAEGINMILD